ncbi:LamG-like jellyroll fold domain-containing protein [Actinomadura sp. 6N118]|uniref:LamG-like jellyroll fold domain-containing protein n=1 Tax=Actinomadura sp. 6N118 TaxID=3375151 RepID=UPI0037992133
MIAVISALVLLGSLLQVTGSPVISNADAAAVTPKLTETDALATARKSGTQVEVLSRRGETREVFALPDGRFMAREHLEPVRTLKDGEWVKIDTDLAKTPTGVKPKASTVDVRFSAGGSGPMASMTRAGKSVALTWPGALPEPVLEGDTAIYKSVLPDVDLRLRADAGGFAHVLVVKTAQAAENPQLAKLKMALAAPGLRTQVDAEGQQALLDPVSGGTVFEASLPKMWDSSEPEDLAAQAAGGSQAAPAQKSPRPVSAALAKEPGNSSRVARMKLEVGGGAVTLLPDQAMLSAPETRFPVYIDPRWYTPKSSTNLMVASNGWREYNFTGSMGMGRCPIDLPPAGSYCNENHVKRLFFRIPTSAFIGKQILQAEFEITETSAPSCYGRAVEIWRTSGFGQSSTWNSTKDNWEEKLGYRDVALGHDSSCPSGKVRFNVTNEVRDGAAQRRAYTTFGLKAMNEDDQYAWKKFWSNGYLQVYYNTKPPQPKPSQMSMSPGGNCSAHQWGSEAKINRAPMLYANNLTDPDAAGVEGEQLTAEIVVRWTDPATQAAREWRPPGGAIKKSAARGSKRSSFSVQIPSTAIPQNVLLGWDVRVHDGAVWSNWASTGNPSQCYFVYDPRALPAPVITSTDYPAAQPDDPDAQATPGVGRYGAFSLAFDTRVTKYAYAVNTSPLASTAKAKPGATAVVSAAPTHSLLNQLIVQVWDDFNNTSTEVYQFWVTEGAGPKAHWKMDDAEGANPLADSASEPGAPATTQGSITYQAEGAVGKAVGFGGSSHAATPQKVLDTTKSFAVSAWARLTSKANTSVVIAQDGTRGSSFALYYSASADRWVFNMQDPASDNPALITAVSRAAPILGQWVHLAGVYDHVTKQIHLYVNGTWQATTSQPNTYSAEGPVQIGRFHWKGAYDKQHYFIGVIDDLKAFDRVLTADEVNTMAKVKSQLAGLWHLNIQSGTTSPDESPVQAKNHLSLAGKAAVVVNSDAAVKPADGISGVLDLPGDDADFASVQAPVINTGESFTVSAWVLTDKKPTSSRTVFALDGANNSAIAVRFDASKQDGGRYVLEIADGDKANAAKAVVEHSSFQQGSFGNWDHIAVVYDGYESTITLYVNGYKEDSDLADETVSYRDATRVFAPISTLQLGSSRAYPVGQNWAGQLDEVWALRGALEEHEIPALLDATQKDDWN